MGAPRRRVQGHLAAVRFDRGDALADTLFPQAFAQRRQMIGDQRLDIGIRDGGRGALVLLPFRQDVVGDRDWLVGAKFAKYLQHPALMHRRDVGEKQAHGDRLNAVIGGDGLGDLARAGLVERRVFLAPRGDAATHFKAVPAFHQRLGFDPRDVVMALPFAALDERHVLESLGRDIGDDSALALQHRVGRDGGAEAQMVDITERGAFFQAADDPLARIMRGRQCLPHFEALGVIVVGDEIGEGAAHVDTKQMSHLVFPPCRRRIGHAGTIPPCRRRPPLVGTVTGDWDTL